MTRSLNSPAQRRLREVLRTARSAQGLSQEGLARRLGRPQSFVSKFERGERRLDVVEFLEVADALGLDVAAVIEAVQEAGRPER